MLRIAREKAVLFFGISTILLGSLILLSCAPDEADEGAQGRQSEAAGTEDGSDSATDGGEAGDEEGSSDAAQPAEGGRYAVTSQHELATEAGIEILEAGGTAADAAIAVAGALSVVDPYFSSVLGGGTWALYYDADTGEITSLDGVGPVGSDVDAEDYASKAGEGGMHQSIVPGAWDGWMLWLREYGNLELGEVLEPTLRYAEEGIEVTETMESRFSIRGDQIRDREDTGEVYLQDDGEIPEAGDTIYQRDMAETFRDLIGAYEDERDAGRDEAIQAVRDHFYRGRYAEEIVEFAQERGGYLTLPDFHDFEAEIVEPISIDYKGTQVYQNPPNSQGITQLLSLNILKDYDFSQYELDGADAVHLQVESFKLAFADRYHHIGDPDFVEIPIEELLSDEYADSQRQRIDMDSVLEWPLESGLAAERLSTIAQAHRGSGNTTTYHIVDADGNAAAVTTSLGYQLYVVGDTGIHINNRMRMFSVNEEEPNFMEPGKKVRHTSNPYMALRDGRPYILGGNTGNDMQPQGQVQQFIAVEEFGATAQEAVARARFESRGFPGGTPPYEANNDLRFEDDFDQDVIDELEARGHTIGEGVLAGGAAMLVLDPETDEIDAGADPRGDGTAIVRSR